MGRKSAHTGIEVLVVTAILNETEEDESGLVQAALGNVGGVPGNGLCRANRPYLARRGRGDRGIKDDAGSSTDGSGSGNEGGGNRSKFVGEHREADGWCRVVANGGMWGVCGLNTEDCDAGTKASYIHQKTVLVTVRMLEQHLGTKNMLREDYAPRWCEVASNCRNAQRCCILILRRVPADVCNPGRL